MTIFQKVLLVLLLFHFSGSATVYYVSSSTGNDNNNGLSQNSAWKSLLKVASFSFNDGDIIYLKRGDTFEATKIDITKGITIDAYGTGEKPLINGLYEVTGFEKKKESVYYKRLNSGYPQLLLINGIIKEKGYLPKSTETLDGASGNNLADGYFNGKNFTGGEIVLDLNGWSVSTNPITSHAGSTIGIKPYGFGYYPAAGNRFTIQNVLSALSHDGDWAYRGDTLYIYSEDNIANNTVNVSLCDTLFYVSSSSRVLIKNLSIRGVDDMLLYTNTTSGGVIIENTDVKYLSFVLIGSIKLSTLKITNSTFENIVGFGIKIEGWGNKNLPDTVFIDNCKFKRIGLNRGLGNFSSTWRGFMIFGYASNYTQFSNMRIDSLGYNGISLVTQAGKSFIFNNYISNTNLQIFDGGAIHLGPNQTDTTFVFNNICDNTQRGIYMDNGTMYWQVYNNLLMNGTYSGYFTNDGKYSDIRNNIFWKNERGIFTRDYNYGGCVDLKIYNNIIYTKSNKTAYHRWLGSRTTENLSFFDNDYGIQDYNTYISENSEVKYILYGGGHPTLTTGLEGVKEMGYDENSSQIISNKPSLFYNPTLKDTTIILSDNFIQLNGKKISDSLHLKPFESKVLFNLSTEASNATYMIGKQYNSLEINESIISASVYEYSFSAMVPKIGESMHFLHDGSAIQASVNANGQLVIGLKTSAETYYSTFNKTPKLFIQEGVSFSVKVTINVQQKSLVIVSELGNATFYYSGEIDLSDGSVRIGAANKNHTVNHLTGHMWDINLNNEYFIPLPHTGIAFKRDEDGSFTTIPVTTYEEVYGVQLDRGSNYIAQHGYVNRLGTVIPNNPDCKPAFSLLNYDEYYPGVSCSGKFYFSNSGSDSNSGNSVASPWKNLSKLSSVSLLPGTTIHLKSGDVWNESLLLKESGTENAPITVTSYGEGEKPEIRGWKTLNGWNQPTNWSQFGSNTFKMNRTNQPERLWINGKEAKRGDYSSLNNKELWDWYNGALYIFSSGLPTDKYQKIECSDEISYAIKLEGNRHIQLKNISATGGENAIILEKANNCIVTECNIGYRTQGTGLLLYSDDKRNPTLEIKISRNIFHSGDSIYTTSLRIARNHYGIHLNEGVEFTSISDNYFHGWQDAAIGITSLNETLPFHTINIQNNYITAPSTNYGKGVEVMTSPSSYNIVITNNTISDIPNGSELNGTGLKFHNNLIEGVRGTYYSQGKTNGTGVLIGTKGSTKNMSFANNIIRNCSEQGLKIDVSGGSGSVINNKFLNNIIYHNDSTNKIQFHIQKSAAIKQNTYRGNTIFHSAGKKIIYYGADPMSRNSLEVKEWNTLDTNNNDSIENNTGNLLPDSSSGNREIIHDGKKIRY